MSGGEYGEGGLPPDGDTEIESGNNTDSSISTCSSKKRGRTTKKTNTSVRTKKTKRINPIPTPPKFTGPVNPEQIPNTHNETADTTPMNNKSINMSSSNQLDRLKNAYTQMDSGPFIVYVESSNLNIGMLHPTVLGKKLLNIYPNMRASIINISKFSKKIVKIEFNSFSAANKLVIEKKYAPENCIVYIPTHLVVRQGVIRDVDTSITDIELTQDIESTIDIVSTQRIMRKDANNTLVPTKSVIIRFKGQALPKYVFLNRVRIEVAPYIYRVTQCYNCLRYGHSATRCTYPSRCKHCTEDHNSRDCKKSESPLCINCKGNHPATDNKNCPVFLEQKNIKEIMAVQNLTYREALNLYTNKSYSNAIKCNINTVIPTSQNYPALNSNKDYQPTSTQTVYQNPQNNTKINSIKTYFQNVSSKHLNKKPPQKSVAPPADLFYNHNRYPSTPILSNPHSPQTSTQNISTEQIINVILSILKTILTSNSSIPETETLKTMIDNMLSDNTNTTLTIHQNGGHNHSAVEL